MDIGQIIFDAITYLIALLLYVVERLLCQLLDFLYDMFEMFSGIAMVKYDGSSEFLINVFFHNSIINTIFWGMAVISIALTIAFTVVSLVKKTFDSNEKVKASYGQILTNVFKSILIIILITAIISVVLTACNVLLQQISYMFDVAQELSQPSTVKFTDEDYATMYRILNTVANYSINPTYSNQYNINACYNDIRGDIQVLEKRKLLHLTYKDKTQPDNWQHAIREIYVASDPKKSISLESNNTALNKAILSCMDQLRTNKNFKPLASPYTEARANNTIKTSLGRVVMLGGTFEAARDEAYNEGASFNDALRYPYYVQDEGCDIYDRDECENAFNIGLLTWNHILVLVCVVYLLKIFATILFNCVARIFNILVLYIMAPPFVAVMPLDEGEKFKQWITAFVIQSLGIFGIIISVRLMIEFIPIILSDKLVFFENSFGNLVAKMVFLIGAGFTCSKAGEMISGILANNAGMQSLMAGNVGAQALGATMSAGMTIGKGAMKAGLAVGKGLSDVTGLTTGVKKLGEATGISKLGERMRDRGGLIGMAAQKDYRSDAERTEAAKQQREQQSADNQSSMASSLNRIAGRVDPQQPQQSQPQTPAPDPTAPGGSESNFNADGSRKTGLGFKLSDPPPMKKKK